jgi:hypothetical protein
MDIDYLKVVRDQSLFVAGFFSVFGIIMVDSYYSSFGVKYQFLGLNPVNILYIGFSLIYFNALFIGIFLCVLTGCFVGSLDSIVKIGRYRIHSRVFSYVILGLAILIGGYMSFVTGADTAARDMYLETTSLRQLIDFHSSSEVKSKFISEFIRDGPSLILHSSGDQIVVFHPPTLVVSRPRIDVQHIRISSDDFYSDRAPHYKQ